MIPDVLRFWGASPTANDGLIWVFCIFFISYLVGSIPFGVLISKLYKLGDIRSTGSGNIGATNVLRTGSKSAAFLTLIMDIAKGSIVVFLAKNSLELLLHILPHLEFLLAISFLFFYFLRVVKE